MISSGKKQWDSCLIFTNKYIKVIEHEINIATETANILEKWTTKKESTQIITHIKSLSRKQVADYFQITVETVRNWERNNLINPCEKGALGETLYSSQMLEKISIIYMLRQAGYSMVSIHNSLKKYNHGDLDEVISALNVPYDSDIISVGDKWLYELNKLYDVAQNIPVIVKKNFIRSSITLAHHTLFCCYNGKQRWCFLSTSRRMSNHNGKYRSNEKNHKRATCGLTSK